MRVLRYEVVLREKISFFFFLIRVQWNDDELNETCKTNQNQSMEISGNVAAIDLI